MKKYRLFLLVPLIFFPAQTSFAAECNFGTPIFEGTFTRATDAPFTEHATFPSVNGRATIKLYNGGVEQNKEQSVTAATIRVNGRVVFSEMMFNKQVVYLENQVDLFEENDIEVSLNGKPNSELVIFIFHEDHDGIGQFWHVLEELYATSYPSAEVLIDWFNNNVAEDFIDDAGDRTDERDSWIYGDEGPPVGITLCPVIETPLDVTGTPYTKGHQVSIEYTVPCESGSFLTYMVYNGTNWLWYGDQVWVDPEFKPHMTASLNPYIGYWIYRTGLNITLWDKNYTAYEFSVRSGIVTGPGLPSEGTKLYHMYPEPFLRLDPFNPEDPGGNFHLLLDDSSIQAIPDEAEYTFRLYAEDPEVVTVYDTPLYSFTKIIHKRPVLNANLDDSMFPTLITPSTHYTQEWGIGGTVDVEWENPDNMKVDWLAMWLQNDEAPWVTIFMIDITPGDTTASIDTTGGVWTTTLHISGHDEYERRFALGWLFWVP